MLCFQMNKHTHPPTAPMDAVCYELHIFTTFYNINPFTDALSLYVCVRVSIVSVGKCFPPPPPYKPHASDNDDAILFSRRISKCCLPPRKTCAGREGSTCWPLFSTLLPGCQAAGRVIKACGFCIGTS